MNAVYTHLAHGLAIDKYQAKPDTGLYTSPADPFETGTDPGVEPRALGAGANGLLESDAGVVASTRYRGKRRRRGGRRRRRRRSKKRGGEGAEVGVAGSDDRPEAGG